MSVGYRFLISLSNIFEFMKYRIYIRFLIVLTVLMSVSACGNLRKVTVDDGSYASIRGIGNGRNEGKITARNEDKKNKDKDNRKSDLKSIDATHPLVVEARKWLGTPYKYGGMTREGADCSGFVMQVYRNATSISLPRNSAAQCDFCKQIPKDELRTGDLIFFSSQSSNGAVAHVGMYIGGGIMIHASSSRGVIETDIETEYYVRNFLTCGRVLEK